MKKRKRRHLVGLSFRECVLDIVRGKVRLRDVHGVLTSTAYPTKTMFLKHIFETPSWYSDRWPDTAKRNARRRYKSQWPLKAKLVGAYLLLSGKIVQPRIALEKPDLYIPIQEHRWIALPSLVTVGYGAAFEKLVEVVFFDTIEQRYVVGQIDFERR